MSYSYAQLESWSSNVGAEARKSFVRWMHDGFFQKYLSGQNILDIGYRGYEENVTAITPLAIGVDLDYPGYDGATLPFPDNSQDAVFNSHVLEHISDYKQAISDWFRVLKTGGFLIVVVPHQFLYERSIHKPSIWNGDHKRFYTAGSLLAEVESAINPIHYRIRHLEDNDRGFDYTTPPELHASGCYEIIMVLEKLATPFYIDEIMSPHPLPSVSEVLAMDDRTFVEATYRLILRRPADAGGLEGHLSALLEGMDRLTLWKIFAASTEMQVRGLALPKDIAEFIENNESKSD